MCDCARAKDVDRPIKTITIFQKSTNLSIQHACCTEEVLDGTELTNVGREETPFGVCKIASDTDDICPTNPSSSESSTDSARIYKFVNQWELECKCDVGDEGGEFESNRSCDGDDLDKFDDEASDVECTLAIIKPDAVVNRSGIEYRIDEAGIAIQQTRWLQMTSEQVSEFYADNYGKPNFANLVAYMASGPIVVHVLAKKQVVQEWRTLIGPPKVSDARLYFPDSIRARYGRKGQDYKNAVHGSASREEAEREIHFFFPDFIVEPLPRWKRAEIYLWEVVNKVLVKGLALCCQQKPADPILWLTNWLLTNNPNTLKL